MFLNQAKRKEENKNKITAKKKFFILFLFLNNTNEATKQRKYGGKSKARDSEGVIG